MAAMTTKARKTETLGQRLRAARKAKGLSQWQLGDLVGLRQSQIADYELDRRVPRDTRLAELLEALDLLPQRSPTSPPLSIAQAAAALGMNARRVLEICRREKIGRPICGDVWLVTVADLPRIAAGRRPVGNPNFRRGSS